jgi:hypothetical protein
MMVSRGSGEGELGELLLNCGVEFQFCKVESSGSLLHNSLYILTALNCTLHNG